MYLFAASDVALLTAGFLLVSSVYFLVAIGQGIYVPELFATSYQLTRCRPVRHGGRAASARWSLLPPSRNLQTKSKVSIQSGW